MRSSYTFTENTAYTHHAQNLNASRLAHMHGEISSARALDTDLRCINGLIGEYEPAETRHALVPDVADLQRVEGGRTMNVAKKGQLYWLDLEARDAVPHHRFDELSAEDIFFAWAYLQADIATSWPLASLQLESGEEVLVCNETVLTSSLSFRVGDDLAADVVNTLSQVRDNLSYYTAADLLILNRWARARRWRSGDAQHETDALSWEEFTYLYRLGSTGRTVLDHLDFRVDGYVYVRQCDTAVFCGAAELVYARHGRELDTPLFDFYV